MIGVKRWAFPSFAALSCGVVATWLVLLHSSIPAGHPDVASLGAAFDLTISIPFFYWLLVIRKGVAPLISLPPVVVVCAVFARFAVPSSPHYTPHLLEFLAAPAEIIFLILFTRRAFAVVRDLPEVKGESDPMDRLRLGLERLAPSRAVVSIVMSELEVFYFAFLSWRRRAEEDRESFSVETSAWMSLLAGLLCAILFESLGLHLWIRTRSAAAAWGLTALDLYGVMWLIADGRALLLRRVTLGNELRIRIGLRWDASIPLSQVRIEQAAGERAKGTLRLTPMEEPGFLMRFDPPVTFGGLYGIRRTVSAAEITVRDASRFEESAREQGIWQELTVEALPAVIVPAIVERRFVSRERWMAMRPDYMSPEEWLRGWAGNRVDSHLARSQDPHP